MTVRALMCQELQNAGFHYIDGVWKKGNFWVYEYKMYDGDKFLMDLADLRSVEASVKFVKSLFSIDKDTELHDNEVLIDVDGELHILACFDMGKGYDAWLDRKQVWDNRNKVGDKVVHLDNILRQKFGDGVNYWKIWVSAMFRTDEQGRLKQTKEIYKV